MTDWEIDIPSNRATIRMPSKELLSLVPMFIIIRELFATERISALLSTFNAIYRNKQTSCEAYTRILLTASGFFFLQSEQLLYGLRWCACEYECPTEVIQICGIKSNRISCHKDGTGVLWKSIYCWRMSRRQKSRNNSLTGSSFNSMSNFGYWFVIPGNGYLQIMVWNSVWVHVSMWIWRMEAIQGKKRKWGWTEQVYHATIHKFLRSRGEWSITEIFY